MVTYRDPQDEGRALAYVASIFFSVGLASVSAVTYGFRELLRSARNRWAANWPTASARITTCDVKSIHGRLIDYALGIIGYSYEIENNYYSGYLVRQFWDEQRAWTFVDTCKDKLVLVHYRAENPQTSVLRETEQAGTLPIEQGSFRPPSARLAPFLRCCGPCETSVIGPRLDFITRPEAGPLFTELWSMRSL